MSRPVPTGAGAVDVLAVLDNLASFTCAEAEADPGNSTAYARWQDAEQARAAVAELYAERDRLANIVRDHEAQIRRMTAEHAELMEVAKRAYAVLDGYVTADDSTDEEIKACDDFWAALDKFGGAG